MLVPVVQSLAKGPSSLRGPLPSSGRKEWDTQNRKSVPVPVYDRLNACRKNAVADPSTRVDLGNQTAKKSQRRKIRLRLGGLNNVRPRNPDMSTPKLSYVVASDVSQRDGIGIEVY